MNKKISFRVALFDGGAEPYTLTADTEDQAQAIESDRRFVQWLTNWQTAEIKEKS